MQNVNTDTVIRYVDGSKQQVIDSRDVAKMIGKSHAHLMRDIHDYINVLEPDPKLDSAQFFIESSYIDPNRRYFPEALKVFQDNALEIQDDDLGLEL